MIDIIKWFSVLILLVSAVLVNYVCCDYNLLYRILIGVFVCFFAIFLALLTNHGRLAVAFIRESYIEVRRVVWPTFRESLYTTFIVIVVTMVVSLILWGLDGLLVRIVSLSLRL